jgi:hypothetical protein
VTRTASPAAVPSGTPTPTRTATAAAVPAPRFSALAAGRSRPGPPTWPRNPPPIEAEAIDEFLAARGSPMAGLGRALLDVGWRYNIDPRFLVAISGADTGFGRVLCTEFNAWNWFWHEWCNSPFESWEQALDEVARGLRMYYLDDGLTDVDKIADRYGPLDDPRDTLGLNRHWPSNVTRYLEALGGSRCELTWVRTNAACAGPRPTATLRPTAEPAPDEEVAESTEGEGEEEQAAEEELDFNDRLGPYPAALADLGAIIPVTRPGRATATPSSTDAVRLAARDAAPEVATVEEPERVEAQAAPVAVEPAAAAEATAGRRPPSDVLLAALIWALIAGGALSRLVVWPRRGAIQVDGSQ